MSFLRDIQQRLGMDFEYLFRVGGTFAFLKPPDATQGRPGRVLGYFTHSISLNRRHAFESALLGFSLPFVLEGEISWRKYWTAQW